MTDHDHDHDHSHSHDHAHAHAHDHAAHDHDHGGGGHGHDHDHGDDPFHGNIGAELNVDDLDPANKSLAEALRVSFAILKIVMIALAALFLLSGFFQVKQGQVAVVLHFGSVSGLPGKQVYQSGTYLAYPPPIDQVIMIPTTPQSIFIDESFWYFVKPEERGLPTDKQTVRSSLTPGQDGSLITGDKNIVHGKWTINYSILPDDAVDFARNVGLASDREIEALPHETSSEANLRLGYLQLPAERRSLLHADTLIRSVAEEAIVGVVAGMTSDDYVRKQVNDSKIQHAIMTAIQQRLASLNAGITVASVVAIESIPPRHLAAAFQQVSTEQTNKTAKITAAQQRAKDILGRAAGSGFAEVQAAIEKYDAARKANQGVDAAYQELTAVLDSDRVQGDAGTAIKEARGYQISAATNVKTEADSFLKLLPGYQKSPNIVLDRLWQDTRQAILKGDVDTFYIPSDQKNLILEINRDPKVQKQREVDMFKNGINAGAPK